LALTFLLTGFSLVLAQPGPTGKDEKVPPGKDKEPAAKDKSKLEEWLDQALKSNPDIRVAEAKVQEAEAQLNRTRLQVMQKVATHYHAWTAQKAAVEAAEATWKRLQALGTKGVVGQEDMSQARAALEQAKAKLAEVEAERPYLVGKQPVGESTDEAVRLGVQWLNLRRNQLSAAHALQLFGEESNTQRSLAALALAQRQVELVAPESHSPMAERIRKAMDKPVTLDYKDKPAAEVLDDLAKKADGVPFHVMVKLDGNVTLQSKEPLALATALQMFQDFSPTGGHLMFVVRDYGILVTMEQFLPKGAVILQDFLKAAKQPKAELVSEQEHFEKELKARELLRGAATSNAAAEGSVTAIDKDSSLVKISIGSDAGVRLNQVLHVFRLSKEPGKSKYLGRVKVLDAKDKEAVAQPMGRLTSPVQVGDRVAEQIVGN
jgi:hypothetical protein